MIYVFSLIFLHIYIHSTFYFYTNILYFLFLYLYTHTYVKESIKFIVFYCFLFSLQNIFNSFINYCFSEIFIRSIPFNNLYCIPTMLVKKVHNIVTYYPANRVCIYLYFQKKY